MRSGCMKGRQYEQVVPWGGVQWNTNQKFWEIRLKKSEF